MTKIISLYNHKGGVSKTTTTFNLGWALGALGFRVGIVDLDPQCNLTALVLGLNQIGDFEDFYRTKGNEDIYEKLHPILSGTDVKINPVKPTKTKNQNLFLIAGNTKMSELDIQLTLGLASNKFQPYTQQFVGAVNAIIRKTAELHDLDVMLLDLSPSSGGMNRIVFMGGDYFIIPTSPDFFCYQAIQSLSEMIPDWYEQTKDFRNKKVTNYLPEVPPKFLGVVSQKYNKYAKKMAKSYQQWSDKIAVASQDMATALLRIKPNPLCISKDKFVSSNEKGHTPYNIVNVPDFNSLIAISQNESVPVFEITEPILRKHNKQGAVKEDQLKSASDFKDLFTKLAVSIGKMTDMKIRDKKILSDITE